MERTKVLVEFYSEEPIENVMAMIKYRPEKIIFLGHKDNMITKKIHDIEHFRDSKCPDTELEFIEVQGRTDNLIIDEGCREMLDISIEASKFAIIISLFFD